MCSSDLLFFTQRIDEDQQQKNNQITNGRGGGADVVNTVQSFLALLNSRLTGGHTDVTYSSQSKTADALVQYHFFCLKLYIARHVLPIH